MHCLIAARKLEIAAVRQSPALVDMLTLTWWTKHHSMPSPACDGKARHKTWVVGAAASNCLSPAGFQPCKTLLVWHSNRKIDIEAVDTQGTGKSVGGHTD